VPHISRLL